MSAGRGSIRATKKRAKAKGLGPGPGHRPRPGPGPGTSKRQATKKTQSRQCVQPAAKSCKKPKPNQTTQINEQQLSSTAANKTITNSESN